MIGADAGANPELIQDGVNGLLYKSGDIQDLKEKILWCIQNKTKAKEIGKKSMNYAKKYCQGNCANQIYEIIAHVGGET